MAYSIDPIQDNCYPGTTVLVNKLHIHDEAALQEAEALATYVNASKLEQCPLEGVFDFAHYKAIHRFLFSDLYDWTGQIRTVNISKKGTDFCPAGEIEPQAKLIFDRLKEQNYFKSGRAGRDRPAASGAWRGDQVSIAKSRRRGFPAPALLKKFIPA